jgi:hypothetical protein
MSSRARKLIGSFAVLAFMAAYIWGASLLAELIPANPVAQIIFFAVVGIGWGFPLFPLVAWMNRGSR